MKTRTRTRCHWADAAPTGLVEAAEGWGMTQMQKVFVLAHRDFTYHDDGTGHCRVCGAAIDFERWLEEQEEQPA